MALAAHPDDEDGGALACYSRQTGFKTYTIFFTNGEGGQNETNSALNGELAAIRIQETKAAAKILGSTPIFLGFPDFGYSKTAKETFKMWGGKDSVLARLVYYIRKIKPDVIITNHDTITTEPYRQHGNHQVVGITAFEAFEKAADPTYHPEQFAESGVSAWQVKKLFFRVLRGKVVASDSVVRIDVHAPAAKDDTTSSGQIALKALAEHRSQGMDKITPATAPWFYEPFHQYRLMRSDRSYTGLSLTLFSGIEPMQRPVVRLTVSGKSPELLPFRLSVSPEVTRLEILSRAEPRTYKRTFLISLMNRNGRDGTVTMKVTHQKKVIYRKSYRFAGKHKERIDDTLTLSLKKAIAASPEALRFEANMAGIGQNGWGIKPSIEEVMLKPVFARVSPDAYVGLVETYDRTHQDLLQAFGVRYDLLDSAALAKSDLQKYTAILLDLRAYAYRPDLARNNFRVLEYVKRGGNVICCYHKTFDWNGHQFAPYPITLTRERVTEEDAPVTILVPEHPLLNVPNKLGPENWDSWIQERNLYLPSSDTLKTSSDYVRLLAMSDERETQPPTSLLWARYGKGTYTYTALALYRQLRVLNVGAVKLFLNLISQPIGQ